MEHNPRLRLKYRVAKQPYRCGKYKSRTGNSHGPTPKDSGKRQGMGARRRQGYGASDQPAFIISREIEKK